MRILITGANGYIGTRLLLLLLEKGHHVIAAVRNPQRLKLSPDASVEVIECDLLDAETLKNIPTDIDCAYYLVHAMSDDPELFAHKDRLSALNFISALVNTQCQQLIYLSGLVKEAQLSQHLSSRLEVENIFRQQTIPLTVLRASIIIGAGSASFEMIRDLVEKLPIMVAPRWVTKQCQPIAVADVLTYLTSVLGNESCKNKTFEIGGPEAISYKDMLLRFAKVRNLKRIVITLPVLTPRLSSYWLIFITSTNYYLARSLIDSLKNDSTRTDFSLDEIIPLDCLTYEQSIERALEKIQQNEVISSWRDAWITSELPTKYNVYIEVPKFGCLSQTTPFTFSGNPDQVMEVIFTLGGNKGYYMNWAWRLRGAIDRTFGGIGLRRGKTARKKPRPGDAIDFWRVLLVDEEKRRFLLYAEMRLPGEAWLEFRIEQKQENWVLFQTATFRPKGIWGRLYWFTLYPVHTLIFKGLGKKLIQQGGGKIL